MNKLYSSTAIDAGLDAGADGDLSASVFKSFVATVSLDYGIGTSVITNVGNTTSVGNSTNFSNQDVNAQVSGFAWGVDVITYSFPTKGSFYGADYANDENITGFQKLVATQKEVVRMALEQVAEYTGLEFQEITESASTHANIRVAGSDVPTTSYASYPFNSQNGGDVWLGNIKDDAATETGYAFNTIMHELGHAIGLKHGHQDDGVHGVLPANHNSTEWSIMTYKSYIGADDFYRNADGSGQQSYMANDIATLQFMYGANFQIRSGATVYRWDEQTGAMTIDGEEQAHYSADKIYRTIWDGNGRDTYNLSNYTTDLLVDLRPGEWSTFDVAQLADLDGGTGVHLAHGNILNAHLYEGDTRSYIEDAVGGAGDDEIIGNNWVNKLVGGKGADSLSGGKNKDVLEGGLGADELAGGKGLDTFIFKKVQDSTNSASDRIKGLENTDKINLQAIDADTTQNGNQAFELVGAFGHNAGEMVISFSGGITRLEMDTDGDGDADMTIRISGNHTDFDNFVL